MAAVVPTAPGLAFAFQVRSRLGPVQELGAVDGIRKRIIPILDGEVEGPRLQGTVVPGGADWQSVGPDGLADIHARYTLRAEDGTLISVVNAGVRHGPPEVLARLARGEPVDPSLYYFRTTPRFEVGPGPHDWLRRCVFVGVGERRSDSVVIDVFVLD